MAPAPPPTLPLSPTTLSAILADLTDATASLTDVASRHNTTLERLSLLITRPDIAERLENIHLVAASRARLIAANLLHRALGTLDRVITRSLAELDQDEAQDNANAAVARASSPCPSTPATQGPPNHHRAPPHPTSDIPNPTSPRSAELRQRTLETSRRAASRIISLTNFRPIPLFTKPAPPAVARAYQPGSEAPATQSPPNHQPPPAPPNPKSEIQNPQSPPPSRPRFHNPTFPTSTPAHLTKRAGTATALLTPKEHWP